MLITKRLNETTPTLYGTLDQEAQILFDTIIEFWSDEEQHGFTGVTQDYTDIQYSAEIFNEITGLTVEDIYYDNVTS